MRISDNGGEGEDNYRPQPSAIDIMSKLKPQSTLISSELIINQATGEILEPENKKIVVDVQGSKLKALLNNLKK